MNLVMGSHGGYGSQRHRQLSAAPSLPASKIVVANPEAVVVESVPRSTSLMVPGNAANCHAGQYDTK